MIGQPYSQELPTHPKDAAEWKKIIADSTALAAQVTATAAKLHVTITPTTIAGVSCFMIVPPTRSHRGTRTAC